MEAIHIRTIQPQDNDTILKLYKASNEEMGVSSVFTNMILETELKNAYEYWTTEDRVMYVMEIYPLKKNGYLLQVLPEKKEIVGFVGVLPKEAYFLRELVRFLIVKKHRRKGYGTALLNHVMKDQKVYLTCLSTNKEAVKFYDARLKRVSTEKKFSSRTNEWYELYRYEG